MSKHEKNTKLKFGMEFLQFFYLDIVNERKPSKLLPTHMANPSVDTINYTMCTRIGIFV